jgi:hypothetical protein
MLLLGGLGDHIGAKEDTKTCCGASVVTVACPIGITVTSEGEGALSVMKS